MTEEFGTFLYAKWLNESSCLGYGKLLYWSYDSVKQHLFAEDSYAQRRQHFQNLLNLQ